jgi:hypothetical protein
MCFFRLRLFLPIAIRDPIRAACETLVSAEGVWFASRFDFGHMAR